MKSLPSLLTMEHDWMRISVVCRLTYPASQLKWNIHRHAPATCYYLLQLLQTGLHAKVVAPALRHQRLAEELRQSHNLSCIVSILSRVSVWNPVRLSQYSFPFL